MRVDLENLQFVCFWPADEVIAALKRVNAARGTPDEVSANAAFVRVMNFLYGFAAVTSREQDFKEVDEWIRQQVMENWEPAAEPAEVDAAQTEADAAQAELSAAQAERGAEK